MKILYVTPPWPGFRECLFDGALEANGLPSFNKPLMKLIDMGHQVDFVILNSAYRPEYRETNIKANWLKNSRVWEIVKTDIRFHKKIATYLKLRSAFKKAIKQEKYDFVYAHGPSTSVVRSIAKANRIPFAQRLYGTFLWSKMQKRGRLFVSIRHLTEYLCFITPKTFLLVTNDGSRGDLVLNEIWKKNKPPFKFLYWLNGVDRVQEVLPDEVDEEFNRLLESNYIFYPARFDSWKRQDKAVRIISELSKQGHDIQLLFAGPKKTVGTEYFDEVMSLATELGVTEQVTYLGNLSVQKINALHKHAIASMSLYDVCNLTNVFHEMLSAGAVSIILDDGTTKDFIINGENGFLVTDENEVVNLIQYLLRTPDSAKRIRENAIDTSKRLMKNWDERSEDEVRLIEDYAQKGACK